MKASIRLMRMSLPAFQVKLPPERSVRLACGLILFSYAGCHFLSHATWLLLLEGIQAIGHDILLAPWRTPVGLLTLLAAFLIHLGLGLKALYRRRHLRMPAIEAWQLGLGLTIPLLLAPHVADARLGVALYGLEDSYFRVLYLFWLTDPLLNLPRQLALLIAIWTHGCIGIHMWLRFRPWYWRHAWGLATGALGCRCWPSWGITNAGWDTIVHAVVYPGFTEAHGPPAPGTPQAAAGVALGLLAERLQLAYLAALAATFLLRALRNAYERRRGGIGIHYRSGRRITVPRGFSILEASRWAGIAHVSICGGAAAARPAGCGFRAGSSSSRRRRRASFPPCSVSAHPPGSGSLAKCGRHPTSA